MNLKTRVVMLVVATFVLSMWALAVSVTLFLERDLARLFAANFTEEVNSVADDLDRDFYLHINTLARLAASLSPGILADPPQIERALQQFSDASPFAFSAIYVANSDGIITAGFPRDALRPGASAADLVLFRDAIAGGKPVIGAPLKAATTPEGVAVPIAVPLSERSGAAAGVLVGSVLLSDPTLFGQLDKLKLGKMGWFLVVSPKDRVILGASDRSRVLTSLPGHGVLPLLDRRLDGFEGPDVSVASFGFEVLSVSRKLATTGWIVIASDPIVEIYAPIASLEKWIYASAVLISLAVALILRFFLVHQFAQLREAGTVIGGMTEGSLPLAAIPIARTDEIGELIASFNRLVAERSRLEASLQDSNDRLDGIYRSVGEGILTIDAEQRIVLFNSAAEQIFGYSAAEMMGQHLNVLLPERFHLQHDKHIRGFVANSRRKTGAYTLIYGRRASGEEFPLEASVSQSGSSTNIVYTVILRDITERAHQEQMREQLLRQLKSLSERLATTQEEERGKIAYELHEELGQELMTLKTYLQILGPASGGTQADAHHRQALAVAVHATERIRKLVLNLEPRELEDFGLTGALRTYCRQQADVAGWTLHLDATPPDVRAPRTVEKACFCLLQQGLSNVMRFAQATEVWVDVKHKANELELRIRDNGVGFDHSGENNGLAGESLELFAMQMRAKLVGGSVEIRSTVGAGCEVLAVLPFAIESDEPVRPVESVAAA